MRSRVLFRDPGDYRSHDSETTKALEGIGELEHDGVVIEHVHLAESDTPESLSVLGANKPL
jgi:hypothetical protein